MPRGRSKQRVSRRSAPSTQRWLSQAEREDVVTLEFKRLVDDAIKRDRPILKRLANS